MRPSILSKLLLLVAAGAVMPLAAQTPQPEVKSVTVKHQQPQQDPGERAFQANCSRCHSAPEQISPRISGTVLMHMRVRANLSAKDQADLLKYLAP